MYVHQLQLRREVFSFISRDQSVECREHFSECPLRRPRTVNLDKESLSLALTQQTQYEACLGLTSEIEKKKGSRTLKKDIFSCLRQRFSEEPSVTLPAAQCAQCSVCC
jgi:hypothetical protein